ncbi:MAG TPA: hypothetical protein VI260_22355 [Blastocatellia bacterium]|jgi:hypothetical protein
MKRQLIFLIIILPLLNLFSTLEAYAQGGAPKLTGAEPAPTPKPKGGPRDTKSPSHTPANPTLAFGEGKNGRLDPKTSDKNTDGSYYEEMILSAKSEDRLTFHVEGENPLLGLQILDRNKSEVPVAKDPSGDFMINTNTGGVPADGEYRVRVTGVLIGKSASPFKISVNRLGLTVTTYVERFDQIKNNYRELDPASVEETVAKLEALGRASPSYPTAFELLGRIYLGKYKDVGKAEVAMDQAIKARGVALVHISFDNKWRQMAKSRSGNYDFEDSRQGWLKIGPGKVMITDMNNKELVSLSGLQIKDLSKPQVVTKTATHNLVSITDDNTRKTYFFIPQNMQPAETDLVIRLIQNHVVGKTF